MTVKIRSPNTRAIFKWSGKNNERSKGRKRWSKSVKMISSLNQIRLRKMLL